MPESPQLILGEHCCTLDERHRLVLPGPLLGPLARDGSEVVLAKERTGCLSLWQASAWKMRLERRVKLIEGKLEAEMLGDRLGHVQMLGRLLSSRHADVRLDARGRLTVPERFREFLEVERGDEVVVVGAAVCVEIWKPATWSAYQRRRMPKFRRLLEELSK